MMFGRDEHFQGSMRHVFAEILIHVFRKFDQTQDGKLSDVSDLLETFFGFNTKIVKRLPAAYVDCNVDCIKLINYGKSLKSVLVHKLQNGLLQL